MFISFSLISGVVAHNTGGIYGLCHEYMDCQSGLKCEDHMCELEEGSRESPMDGTKLCGYLAGMPTYSCFDGDVCDQPSSEAYGMCVEYSSQPVLGSALSRWSVLGSGDPPAHGGLGTVQVPAETLPAKPYITSPRLGTALGHGHAVGPHPGHGGHPVGPHPVGPVRPVPIHHGPVRPHPIGTIYIQLGGQCGGAPDPFAMKRECQPSLTCHYGNFVNPGGFGTCQYPQPPHKVTYTSQRGGHCGGGDSPSMAAYVCAYGLRCQSPPHNPAFGPMAGAYGTCVLSNWIPQQRVTVYFGDYCGQHSGGHTVYVCDAQSGLTCQHSVCQRSWNPPPVNHQTSPQGGICGSATGTGTYTCQSGLYCLGYIPGSGTYGSCQPNGRRMEADDSLEAPEIATGMDELEAPLDD